MMMSTQISQSEIHVSLEELALLLNLMGYPVVAKGLLKSQLGDISADEERGRLLAANHTLLANNLVTLDDGTLQIAPDYAELIDYLPNNQYAVRCVLTRPDARPDLLTYYVRDGRLVEQRIRHGAVHALRYVASFDEALEAIAELLALEGVQPQADEAGHISVAALEGLTTAHADAGAASEYLQSLGWAKGAADAFAADSFEQRCRVGLLRVVMDPERAMPADRSSLAMVGRSGRVWLMGAAGDEGSDNLLVRPVDADSVLAEARALLEAR